MRYRIYKVFSVVLVLSILFTAVFTPNISGYEGFLAAVFISLTVLFCPIYCLYAYNIGEIMVYNITVKRCESPLGFWAAVAMYLILSIVFLFMLFMLFMQPYT